MIDDTLPLYTEKTLSAAIQKMDSIAPETQSDVPYNKMESESVTPPCQPTAHFKGVTLLLGPQKTVTTCPFCQTSVLTSIKHTTTTRTHMTAVLCSFICCCCCIPYCCNSARNTDHYCPSCSKYLGTYEK